MASRQDEIETRIESLAQQVAELRSRVHGLEVARGAGPPGVPAISSSATERASEFSSLREWGSADIVGLAGRSLVILGGAFLLRAVSAAALLPDISGPLLGLLYAAWWMRQTDRTAAADQRTSAFFYGLSSIAIAFPLIWETTARFHLLPAAVASPALVAFLAAGLVVSWRRGLPALAWISVIAMLATTVALLLATREFVLGTATLLAAAVTVEWFCSHERWPDLRWAPAAALDVTLALLAALVSQPHLSAELAAQLDPRGVIAVSLFAPIVYVVSVASATLVYRRAISAFEVTQVVVSLLAGIGTALVTIAFRGGDPFGIAVAIVVIGAACYAVAFRSMDVDEHPRRNFYAYTSFAGILVGVGTTLLLDGAELALVWLALACVATALGVRHERNTLRLHGALYLSAASLCSGLATLALGGLLGPLEHLHLSPAPAAAAVALGSVACYGLLAARRGDTDAHWSVHVPPFLAAAVIFSSIAGLAAPWLTSLAMALHSGLDQNACLASMRTAVLSVMAAALALAGRRWTLDELVWLVYPLMIFGGGRLLWEDLRYGGPMHLFFALAFYGGALIVTSRVLRHRP